MPRVLNGGLGSKTSLARSGSTESHEMADLDDQEQGASDDDDDPDENESIDPEHNHQGVGERTLLVSARNPKHGQESLKVFTPEGTWPFIRKILVETTPTLLLTIIGLTFTGELLEQVTRWRAMEQVDELYILIPILNNLKGNIEMNLSSRLSTAAMLGELDVLSIRKEILYGTMSLLQVQALIVSAIAAVLSFLLGRVIAPTSHRGSARGSYPRAVQPIRKSPSFEKPSGLRESVMVLCTSMASASLSGLVLGSFMCSLVVICRRFRRNPDNIAPPMASCLGDLLTLCILGLVSSVLIRVINTVLPMLFVVLLTLCAVGSVMLTLRNDHVRGLIGSGWIPLFGAMFISSGTGLILEHFVTRYEGFGLLAVAISGIPDAVGSVFVSRISTSLHASVAKPFPETGISIQNPRIRVTMMTLFSITLPIQLLYVTFLHVSGWMTLPWLFVILFVFFFCCAVLSALVVANLLTHFLWRRDLDPDTYAMPIQSSIVDLVGQTLLVVCYEIAQRLGADVKNKH